MNVRSQFLLDAARVRARRPRYGPNAHSTHVAGAHAPGQARAGVGSRGDLRDGAAAEKTCHARSLEPSGPGRRSLVKDTTATAVLARAARRWPGHWLPPRCPRVYGWSERAHGPAAPIGTAMTDSSGTKPITCRIAAIRSDGPVIFIGRLLGASCLLDPEPAPHKRRFFTPRIDPLTAESDTEA